jgi:CRP-like cAMP-binding protein
MEWNGASIASAIEAIPNLPPARRYPADSDLYLESESLQDPLLVVEGRVKLSALGARGNAITLVVCGPNSLLGLSSVLCAAPTPVTATTLTTCSLRRVPTSQLLPLLRNDSRVAWVVSRALAEQALVLSQRAWSATITFPW